MPCNDCSRAENCPPCVNGEDPSVPSRRNGPSPQAYVDVLTEWQFVGMIGPSWSVDYSAGDGCFFMTFTLFATWGPSPRRYRLNEHDFCQRIIALADMFPDETGPAAVVLADEVREVEP